MTLTTVSQNSCFGGVQGVYSHASPETGCTMRFGLFLPPQAKEGLVPVLYWLSGLTCTEENFIVKAGAQRVAAELGIGIKTVEKHREHLMAKLNIHDTAGLTRYAIGAGIIESSVQLTVF